MRRPIVILVVGLLGSLAGAAVARTQPGTENHLPTELEPPHAAPRSTSFAPVGTGMRSAVKTDGVRYAAYLDPAGATRILDQDGRDLKSFQTPGDFQPTTLAQLQAPGGGYLLWNTRAAALIPGARVIEIATGQITDVDTGAWWRYGFSYVYLREMGRSWISAGQTGMHSGFDTYLNWRTGRIANNVDPMYEPGNRARNFADLDAPQLWRPLCRPLRRQSAFEPGDVFPGSEWLPYQYSHPYGLRSSSRGKPLLLDRCGRRKAQRVSRCRRSCAFPSLGAGVVIWAEGRHVYAYRAGSRCERRWTLPRPARELFALAHTRSSVFASFIDPRAYGTFNPVWTDYVVRLPPCLKTGSKGGGRGPLSRGA